MKILICPLSDPGYLYPSLAVGRELARRGHDAQVLARASMAPAVAEAGLAMLVAEDYRGHGAFNVIRWVDEGDHQYRTIRRVLREFRADVLVTSALCHGALLAAEALDIPVAVLGFAAHIFDYKSGGGDEPHMIAPRDWVTQVMTAYYTKDREKAGLPPRKDEPFFTPLLGTVMLLRGDSSMELPGAVLPDGVRHIGPCVWEPTPDPAEVRELTEHLDRIGKPVVYVHVGRVFRSTDHWPRLNAAFTGSPFQAVVELGRSKDPRPDPAAELLIVRKPWMAPLIARAELVLTSGTSAPVLGALTQGRPLGVTPAGSEQPLLAEACLRAGVAVRVSDEPGPDPASVLTSAWQDDDLHARARALGRMLVAADGSSRAADVVERIVCEETADVRGSEADAAAVGDLAPSR